MDAGVDVIDIGLAGTEEVYFAAFHLDVDGGIEVTASHNPMDYNGMKLVRRGAQPVSGDTGLKDIERLAAENAFPPPARRGVLTQQSILQPYVEHLLGYIEPAKLKPLKLVVNAGNGAAGHVIDVIEVALQGTARSRRVHQGSPRAGRQLPQRHSQPAAARKPGGHGGCRHRPRRRHGHRLGWRLRPLLPLR